MLRGEKQGIFFLSSSGWDITENSMAALLCSSAGERISGGWPDVLGKGVTRLAGGEQAAQSGASPSCSTPRS